MVKKFLKFTKEKRGIINKIFPFIIASYFILVSLPNISFLSFIFSKSIFNNLYRALVAILFLSFSSCYWFANDFKVGKQNKACKIFVISTLIFLGISLLSPLFGVTSLVKSTYSDGYFRIIEITPSLGLISYFSYYGNLLINFVFIYFFFILIGKIKDKKLFYVTYLTLIGFTGLACVLSIFLDYKNFLEVFQMNSTGYGSFDISSIFTSKNTFGAYLMLTVIFSTYLAFCKNKLFFISTGVSFVFLVFSLSKTAITVALLYIAFSYFYQLHQNYKKNRKAWQISLATIFIIILAFIVFVLTPINKQIKICSYINKFMFGSSNNSIKERMALQLIYFKNVKPLNLIFGYGNSLEYNTYYWTRLEHNYFASISLENGYLQILGSYGIFSLLFYLFLYYLVISSSLHEKTYFAKSKIIVLLVFSIYMLMERYYLFIGGGGITFLVSLFTTIDLQLPKEQKGKTNENFLSISI